VEAGAPLATLHSNSNSGVERARQRLRAAIPVVDAPVAVGPLVAERLEAVTSTRPLDDSSRPSH
jgi:thymidine phosphorylase